MPARGPQHQNKPGHREIGAWAWNDHRLWSKIDKTTVHPQGCHTWQSAMSPTGGLMGAWKAGIGQMTQARRLVWMSINNQDVTPYRVTMTCNNPECVNPEHFILKPNNRIKRVQYVERRTDLRNLAELSEDQDTELKECCKKFANDVTYNISMEYYSVRFTQENWMLAKLALPEIESYLK